MAVDVGRFDTLTRQMRAYQRWTDPVRLAKLEQRAQHRHEINILAKKINAR